MCQAWKLFHLILTETLDQLQGGIPILQTGRQRLSVELNYLVDSMLGQAHSNPVPPAPGQSVPSVQLMWSLPHLTLQEYVTSNNV